MAQKKNKKKYVDWVELAAEGIIVVGFLIGFLRGVYHVLGGFFGW